MNKCNYTFTQNRELSWLKFNERVLEEADDRRVPLLERLKFIAIFTSNLDEFFMIRCGSLVDLSLVKSGSIDNKSGMTPSEQLSAIYANCVNLYKHRDTTFNILKNCLAEYDVLDLEMCDLDSKEEKYVHTHFRTDILPVLSPQIIDVHHPFPHLVNKSLHIVMILKHKNKRVFGLIPVPSSLKEVLYLASENEVRYLLIEKIIFHYAQEIFSNYQIEFKTIVSLTRNADINLDTSEIDDDDDYRQYMKKILKKRTRLAPIRLEVYQNSSDEFIKYMCSRLNIEKQQIFISNAPLKFDYVFPLIEKMDVQRKKRMSYQEFTPQPNKFVKEGVIIPQLEYRDLLLSYPFESMHPFLQLLKEASVDKNVISIKMTIYRLSSQSKIIKYLCAAAENGVNVTVLMELRARFDEASNINYAEVLEESGCQILYGFENYKVHSKICLITRKQGKEIQYITQIGTGNYNEKTSRMYTDLSYITTREEIGQDAMSFFQNMAVADLYGKYEHLLIAPHGLKNKLMQLIDEEIEKAVNHTNASIIMKMNSLTDRDLIDKLEEASCAGVKIRLIIRGICCLVPQVKDHTENIEVISIVGRFLEHSRIYCFGSDHYASIYISSADLMTRNTEKRVEIACPIEDNRSKKQILHILHVLLNDNVKARKLNSLANYEVIHSDNDTIDSQEYFMMEALKPINNEEVVPANQKVNLFYKLQSWFHKK
ncbi:MAG: polyphosphate kinase 1 [Bacilli bacterium]|nr:polyphosphate kinase 1 [Bacilli bacterium]